jgi:hypothetical protein
VAIAPEPILRAANETIYAACVDCRAAAYAKKTSPEMVAELMDAVHDVAHALVNWKPHHSADYIRTHFGCFRSNQWPDMRDLVKVFDRKLEEYGQDAV